MKIITLQRPATCADCGAYLPAGTRARYYSEDQIYCESHDKPAPRQPAARDQAARPTRPSAPEAMPLFPDQNPDIEAWIKFLQEVQAALGHLIDRLRSE